MIPLRTVRLIEQQTLTQQFRSHLGASIIGADCGRQIWYSFRWFKQVVYDARIVRLFERGNLEEQRFKKQLQSIGVTVWSHTGNNEQFSIRHNFNHFGGHLDSICFGLPEYPNTHLVAEFKTHNNKNFCTLKKKNLRDSFWHHYVQATIYTYKVGLKRFLYVAVNKDTDELYFEILKIKRAIAQKYLDRAEYIIFSSKPPVRIASRSTFYKCKFCDYADICHNSETPVENCRTCVYSKPVKPGWLCKKHKIKLTKKAQLIGCGYHKHIQ